jgi:hypothetical protein
MIYCLNFGNVFPHSFVANLLSTLISYVQDYDAMTHERSSLSSKIIGIKDFDLNGSMMAFLSLGLVHK